MSKARLKKELLTMTTEQITELVLDLYDARRAAKEYLEFFLDPDIDAYLTKAKEAVTKELAKSARRRNKAKISVLRQIIKDWAALNPGEEEVQKLRIFTIGAIVEANRRSILSSALIAGTARLISDTIVAADRIGRLDTDYSTIHKIIESISRMYREDRDIRSTWFEALEDAMQSVAL